MEDQNSPSVPETDAASASAPRLVLSVKLIALAVFGLAALVVGIVAFRKSAPSGSTALPAALAPVVAGGQPALAPNAPVNFQVSGSAVAIAPPPSQRQMAINPPPSSGQEEIASAWKSIKGGATIPSAAPAARKPAAGGRINPPHGEPGHECSIPVGEPIPAGGVKAPLPGVPPGEKNQSLGFNGMPQGINMNPGGPPGVPPAAPRKHAAGWINPAHGQPDHDCAIPVGQGAPK